jgi:hypothetical protein
MVVERATRRGKKDGRDAVIMVSLTGRGVVSHIVIWGRTVCKLEV